MSQTPTQKQLSTLVREWQKRLRLMDWKVEAKVVDHLGFFGRCQFKVTTKDALIEVCSLETLDPERLGVRDWRVTAIHEMMHLHVAPFHHLIKDDSPESDAMEAMVELTAIALVEAKEGKKVK